MSGYDEDIYGLLRPGQLFRSREGRIAHLEQKINEIMELATRSPLTPAQKRHLVQLQADRDKSLIRAAAKRGADIAQGGVPGVSGGVQGAGIRGDAGLIERDFGPQVVASHNAEQAQQGFRGMAYAPPGSGRLVTVPFIVDGAVGNIMDVPLIALIGGGAGTGLNGAPVVVGTAVTLLTRPINYAALQTVGLQTQSHSTGAGIINLMRQLRIEGSATLFMSERWLLMDEFDVDQQRYGGLRAYPVLRSPNQAQIQIAAAGNGAVWAAVILLTETLRDDAFGPGLPGPWGA